MNALLQVPPRLLLFTGAGEEEEEEHEATFGADALRYQLMKLQDAYGRIPANAYARAKSQVDLLKSSGAARRVEQAPPVPVAPTMFSRDARRRPRLSRSSSPKSWRWLGPGNIGGRIRSIVVHPAKPGTPCSPAASAAASGRRPTAARAGRRSTTSCRCSRCRRWSSTRPTPTSCSRGRARATATPTRCAAPGSSRAPTAARRGRSLRRRRRSFPRSPASRSRRAAP